MFQLFLRIIYIRNIGTFKHRTLYIKNCYNSKSFWVLTIYSSDFWDQNISILSNQKIIHEAKYFNSPKLYTTEILPAMLVIFNEYYS